MIILLDRDLNGNRTVKVKIGHNRAFTIQSNGNLPKTHRTFEPDLDEIRKYVFAYGTHRQKELMKEEDNG